jgi:hypothetical protein
LYSPQLSVIGPQHYPPAFPAMLAPLYARFGLRTFAPYQIEGLVLTALALLLVAWWCLTTPPVVNPVPVVGFLALSPAVLGAAVSVVSDPLFVVFTVGALLWLDRLELDSRRGALPVIAGGLMVAAAYLTRSAGVALVAAVVLRAVLRGGRGWARTAVVVSTALVAGAGIEHLMAGAHAASDYADTFAAYRWTTPFTNLRLYVGDFATEFLVPIAGASRIAKLALIAVLGLMASGLVRTRRVRPSLTIWECFVVTYGGLILVWPAYQGVRMLLPLLPWAVRLTVAGFEEVRERLGPVGARRALTGVMAASAALFLLPSAATEVAERHMALPDGTRTADVQDMLAFVSQATPGDAVLAAARPRAVALYGARHAVGIPYEANDSARLDFFRRYRAGYVLIDRNERRDAATLMPMIVREPGRFTRVFANERFALFAIGP